MADPQHIRSILVDTARAAGFDKLPPELYGAAFRYLDQFGYLDGLDKDAKPIEVAARVAKAQEILGIAPDGIVGPITHKRMTTTPRCGLKDYGFARDRINQWLRSKATVSPGISWFLKTPVRQFDLETQAALLAKCFSNWSAACGALFHRVLSEDGANIVFGASAAREEEFGRAGDVLAWMYLAQGNAFNGQLHGKFDLAEKWTPKFFESVGTHEIGHALGMDHTEIRLELMFAIFDPNIWTPQPRYDTPQGQLRYGQSSGATPPPPPPVDPPPPPPPGTNPMVRLEVPKGIDLTLFHPDYQLFKRV